MVQSRRKALKDLSQSKVVNISDYRSLKQGREAYHLAFISEDAEFYKQFQEQLPEGIECHSFENRFAFEQAFKSREWDGVILDERSLKEEAMQVCEKLKRQERQEEMVIIIFSDDQSKEKARQGLEMGCDEWVTQAEPQGLLRLLSHHLSFR